MKCQIPPILPNDLATNVLATNVLGAIWQIKHRKQGISHLDAPNPLLQVLFSQFSIALPNHHAWRVLSSLQIDGTIALLGRLDNGPYLVAGCHVVGLYQSAVEHLIWGPVITFQVARLLQGAWMCQHERIIDVCECIFLLKSKSSFECTASPLQ